MFMGMSLHAHPHARAHPQTHRTLTHDVRQHPTPTCTIQEPKPAEGPWILSTIVVCRCGFGFCKFYSSLSKLSSNSWTVQFPSNLSTSQPSGHKPISAAPRLPKLSDARSFSIYTRPASWTASTRASQSSKSLLST